MVTPVLREWLYRQREAFIDKTHFIRYYTLMKERFNLPVERVQPLKGARRFEACEALPRIESGREASATREPRDSKSVGSFFSASSDRDSARREERREREAQALGNVVLDLFVVFATFASLALGVKLGLPREVVAVAGIAVFIVGLVLTHMLYADDRAGSKSATRERRRALGYDTA